ncbi:MAG: BlaI/MecI/CopY family transcriptional regulator [Candidatus Zixiibacteriota bacterium]
MARKKSPTLTDAELKLMETLWARGSASINDVVAALPADEPLAYNTVLTTMRILERKGYVSHTKIGRAHIYHPLVDRSTAQDSAVKHVLNRFFDSSAEQLALHILEQEKLTHEDIERLRALIGKGKK